MSEQTRRGSRNSVQDNPRRSFGGIVSSNSAPARYTSAGGSSAGGSSSGGSSSGGSSAASSGHRGDKRPARRGSSNGRNQRVRVNDAENEDPVGEVVDLAKVCRILQGCVL